MTKEELQLRIRAVEVRNGKAQFGRELTEAILAYAAPLRAAGQSQTGIAGELGIKAFTLQRWHQNVRKAEGAKREGVPSNELAFVRLEPVNAESEAVASFEVVLGNGRVVRVPAGFDGGALTRVLAVVEGVEQ